MKNQARESHTRHHSPNMQGPASKELISLSAKQTFNVPPWIQSFRRCLAAYVDSHPKWFQKQDRRSKRVITRTIYSSKRTARRS